MQYLEDIEIGTTSELGSHTFSADEIIAFAEKYDRQPFHLDEVAAKESHFGGLVASGWHTAGVCMRLFVETLDRQRKDMEAAGRPCARLGPSPGFEQLKWVRPVHAGDTISYSSTVSGKRALASRPEWGMLFLDVEGRNQRGELVYSYKSKTLIERKPKAVDDKATRT